MERDDVRGQGHHHAGGTRARPRGSSPSPSDPKIWDAPTACEGWSTGDVVGHIIDTTEGYFRAFDAAHGSVEAPAPYGLAVMAEKANAGATAFRGVPQAELVERLRTDFDKMQGILEPIGPDDWTGFMVTHPYMGPVPAFFYAAGQLMDYGVHSWDIRQTTGRPHALSGEAADLLVPFMFAIWQGTVRSEAVGEPFTIGIRVSGANAGDYRVSVSDRGDDLRARGDREPAHLHRVRCGQPGAQDVQPVQLRHRPG